MSGRILFTIDRAPLTLGVSDVGLKPEALHTMSTNPTRGRYLLWIAALLLFIITPVIIKGVIPAVETNTSTGAKPETSVFFLWTCAVFSCSAALVLALVAARVRTLGGSSRFLLVTVVLTALLFSFAISDAALDIELYRPALEHPVFLLRLCSDADLIIPTLIIIAVVLLPKRRGDDLPPAQGVTAH